MSSRLRTIAVGALVACTLVPLGSARAQGLAERLRRRAEQRAAQNLERKVDEVVDCAMGDRVCIERATRAGKAVRIDSSGAARGGGGGSGGNATGGEGGGGRAAVGAGAFVNFDFKPGDRPLFVEDFTRDRVGNFPRRLQFKEGAFEIVDWNGQRLLRATDKSRLIIPLPEALPERFTVEIDLVPASNYYDQMFIALGDVNDWDAWHEGGKPTIVMLRRDVTNTRRPQLTAAGGGVKAVAASRTAYAAGVDVQPLRLLVDGTYLKGYLGGERLINVPNAVIPRGKSISLALYAHADHPAHIGQIRVMAGGRALYDAISEKGRVATQGIFFATGSDRIRPESKPTLDEIGAMLRDHPELALTIEGHTDNVGGAADNLALSDRRAAAVKQALVSQYGVDASRLETKGLGQTKPAAGNDTPEGRQQNRRVELVKRG
ncbi:MAG: OmpA family protein [Gemmatimonadaceae bacterium]|jgi:outer membrane protein OmpA-like peptidoglycan-associated protein|nr:OmpA family protein [Gemmatimonadaceae bacterium]